MDRPPGFEGKSEGCEIFAEQHDIGDIAGDVGGRGGEGDADIGDLQCGRIVDSIADHRDALAGALQIGDDLQLLRRRQPRKDARRISRHCGGAELIALDDLRLPVWREAELSGDRDRRRALIAGQHHRRDAGALQGMHQLGCAAADRVGHADEAEPDEIR